VYTPFELICFFIRDIPSVTCSFVWWLNKKEGGSPREFIVPVEWACAVGIRYKTKALNGTKCCELECKFDKMNFVRSAVDIFFQGLITVEHVSPVNGWVSYCTLYYWITSTTADWVLWLFSSTF
jgi:hypothetical protein